MTLKLAQVSQRPGMQDWGYPASPYDGLYNFGSGATPTGAPGLTMGAPGVPGLRPSPGVAGAYGSLPNWGTDAPKGLLEGTGLGFNMPTMQLGLQGLGSLASLWMGNKSLGMAKDQFNFTKDMTNTNLNNQLQTYNTSLEDRLRTRGQFNQDDPTKAKEEFERLKLSR